jgi:hypothetical protein
MTLTGIEPYPHGQFDAVAIADLTCQWGNFLLDTQCGKARPHGVVFQRHRCAEHRHKAIAGELVHRAAVTQHYRRRAIDQLGHDLPQALRTYRRGDVHRVTTSANKTVTCLYSADRLTV